MPDRQSTMGTHRRRSRFCLLPTADCRLPSFWLRLGRAVTPARFLWPRAGIAGRRRKGRHGGGRLGAAYVGCAVP